MNLRQVGQSENKKNAKCLVKLPYEALKVHERKYLQEPHRELKISCKSVKGIAEYLGVFFELDLLCWYILRRPHKFEKTSHFLWLQ